MESLIFFVLLGALAFLMMRGGGCGAHGHAGHGGHKHGTQEEHGPQAQRGEAAGPGAAGPVALVPAADPVCGTTPAPDQGYGKMHEGRAYRFCSRRCLDAFEAEPQRYALAARPEDNRRHGHGC